MAKSHKEANKFQNILQLPVNNHNFCKKSHGNKNRSQNQKYTIYYQYILSMWLKVYNIVRVVPLTWSTTSVDNASRKYTRTQINMYIFCFMGSDLTSTRRNSASLKYLIKSSLLFCVSCFILSNNNSQLLLAHNFLSIR